MSHPQPPGTGPSWGPPGQPGHPQGVSQPSGWAHQPGLFQQPGAGWAAAPQGGPYGPPAVGGRQTGGVPPLLGLVVAGAAVLMGVAVLLPWVQVTVQASNVLPSAPSGRILAKETGNGLASGVTVGWLTLLCAAAAAVLGVLGTIRRDGRLTGVAAIPGVIAVGTLLAVLARLDSAKSRAIDKMPRLPPAIAEAIRRNIHVTLDFGWYLALLMSVVVIGSAVAAVLASAKQRPQAGLRNMP